MAIDKRRLERITKGYANHYRIEMLALLRDKPELSLTEVATKLHTEIKNASQHLAKMEGAGLIMKRHDGVEVRHALTARGLGVLKFLESLK